MCLNWFPTTRVCLSEKRGCFGRLLRVWGILAALPEQQETMRTRILTLGTLGKVLHPLLMHSHGEQKGAGEQLCLQAAAPDPNKFRGFMS